MKNFLLFTLSVCLFSCTSSKTSNTRYFDQYNVEINRAKFNKSLSDNQFLDLPGDYENSRKLIPREKRGRINDRNQFEATLEANLGVELAAEKPIVVIYHPGKDDCNSSSNRSAAFIKTWYGELEDGLNQIADIDPLYIYKESSGLEKYDGIIEWNEDPEGIIERLFFKMHYPCKSFVVVSKQGDYISYFGEFSKEYVWEAAELMEEYYD